MSVQYSPLVWCKDEEKVELWTLLRFHELDQNVLKYNIIEKSSVREFDRWVLK